MALGDTAEDIAHVHMVILREVGFISSDPDCCGFVEAGQLVTNLC